MTFNGFAPIFVCILQILNISGFLVTFLKEYCIGYARKSSPREKCSECLPLPFMYSGQTISKTLDSFVNWTCGKLYRILFSVTFNSETVLGYGCFQNTIMRRSPDMTFPLHSDGRIIR